MSDNKKKAQVKKVASKKAAQKKPAAKKAPAKKASTKKAPIKKAPAKKAPAKKQAAKKEAAPKKQKQTVESSFDAVSAVEANQIMDNLEETESIKIDFLDDARDTIVEWAKEWVDEESSDFVSVTNDKVEINLNAKNGLLKRLFSKIFKR